MAQGRPDIPTALRRRVLVEAGHRCAIPTCRQTPVELSHITPWVRVRLHKFENLIALCPTCHARFDNGAIDRRAILQYKANLGLLNSRYTQIERQLLLALNRHHNLRDEHGEWRTDDPNPIGNLIVYGAVHLPFGMLWTISNLIDDELVSVEGLNTDVLTLHLTSAGEQLVSRWIDAEPLN
ncbi:HNH endonuclease [Streptomyces sp. NPDC020412]|uniref:HNH endonuclease n=1 Tax=Streptomyces sp. NPDC020412 TaxID=3365073 RepID=UPI00379849C9